MIGWHPWFNGHGFGWTLGVGDGQEGLVCSGSWGHKESDTTERLNLTELKLKIIILFINCQTSWERSQTVRLGIAWGLSRKYALSVSYCPICCLGGQNRVCWKELSTSVQFSSVAQSCLTLCDPMNCSTPGLPVHHQLPEFTQTHVHQVGDAIQTFHPLSSPSLLPPIHPSIRVFSNESTLRMRWPKYWSFSFSIIPSKEIPGLISLKMD